MKKILISDSNDFFSLTLRDILQERLSDEYSISAIPITKIAKETNKTFFEYLVFGVNDNNESEIDLLRDIRKKNNHANIIIVVQNLDIEHIKKIRNIGLNSILLKPVNINNIIERLGL